jgi:NAD(P)-dependent dehydrogenase (short-subunit alcohol dehydrogenase family)
MSNKVVVITGGSSGIGRAAALAFAKAGCNVAVAGRREAEGQETVALIQRQSPNVEACFLQADVRKADQVKAFVDAAAERWGRLDYAFNNAGVEGPSFIQTADYGEDSWDDVIDVNLKGVFLAMKYEIPHMLANGDGAIVNMSSIAGLVGGPIGIAYFASKHGVIGATKAAALEYAARHIRINAVCPAVIETGMADRIFTPVGVDTGPLHPIGRNGTPEEVADAVVWLCSDHASFITGAALPVDGGYTAK